MFIQTEATPNPDSLKFLPGRDVLGSGGRDFASIEEAHVSPLATALFGLQGVERVFLGADFVSVTKAADADWKHVKPMALAAIMDHYMAGLPVLEEQGLSADSDDVVYEGEAAEIVAEIKELLEPVSAQPSPRMVETSCLTNLTWRRVSSISTFAAPVPVARPRQ